MRQQSTVAKTIARPRCGRAIVLGIIGYLILSLRQPPAWTMPIWIGLAFVVVPVIVGLLVGRVPAVKIGARAAYFVAANMMFLYTAINLIRTHAKIASGTDTAQVFFVGVLVGLIYGALAGFVAAAVYVVRAGRTKS